MYMPLHLSYSDPINQQYSIAYSLLWKDLHNKPLSDYKNKNHIPSFCYQYTFFVRFKQVGLHSYKSLFISNLFS